MRTNFSNDDKLSWVDALKARFEPRNYEERLANTSEEDTIENALEQTIEAVFNIPTGEETSEEAIVRSSKDISQQATAAAHTSMINEIKNKLADRETPIDPVALGVEIKAFSEKGMELRPITQDEWDNASDPRFVENVAKLAVLTLEKKKAQAWQENAMDPKSASRSFDPEFSKGGRIMSSPSEADDAAPRFGNVPKNANSIWDSERIQKLSETLMTDHDEQVKESREYYDNRSKKADKARADEIQQNSHMAVSQDTGSQIMPSGSEESEVFIQRVPGNQLSMLDVKEGDFDDLTAEQKKARLQDIFMKKIPNTKEDTKKANEERRQKIQAKSEKDRSWENVNKPLSTADIQKRLVELWIPETPEK